MSDSRAGVGLKKHYEQIDVMGVIYTSGNLQFNADETKFASIAGENVNIVDIKTSKIITTLPGDSDLVTSISLSPDNKRLVVASRSLSVKIYDWEEMTVMNEFIVKEGIVSCIAWDATSTLMAVGTSEGLIKIWDLVQGYCTHMLKGSLGIITALRFYKTTQGQYFLASSAATECTLRIWDLANKRLMQNNTQHTSAVTKIETFLSSSIDVSTQSEYNPCSDVLVTSSRDSTLNVWTITGATADTTPRSGQRKKGSSKSSTLEGEVVLKESISTKEAIEDMVGIPRSLYVKTPLRELLVATVGFSGDISVYNVSTGLLMLTSKRSFSSSSTGGGLSKELLKISMLPVSRQVVCVNSTHDLLFYALPSFTPARQIAGYFDEIIDIKPLSLGRSGTDMQALDSLLAVATNSEQLRIIERSNRTCHLLTGHQKTIMAIDISCDHNFIVTASKDASIRIWQKLIVGSSGTMLGFRCIAKGLGHTDAVGCVKFARKTLGFVVSASLDQTVKHWDTSFLLLLLQLQQKRLDAGDAGDAGHLNTSEGMERVLRGVIEKIAGAKGMEMDREEGILLLKSKSTVKAHDKAINGLCVSPNDTEFATASHDRTVKVWSVKDLSLVGRCSGHKRGVWDVSYSPTDRVLGSSSSDGTVKLWSTEDYACIKTLEGHNAPVLRLLFLSTGLQIATTAADGLIKLWTIRTSECETTLDAHAGKVWALALAKTVGDKTNDLTDVIVTGSTDSTINFWRDVTTEKTLEIEALSHQLLLDDQELSNLVFAKKYISAAKMALKLDKPHTLLRMVKHIVTDTNNTKTFIKLITSLTDEETTKLLECVRGWNTNSRTSDMAQLTLKCVFQAISPDELIKYKNIKGLIEAMLPYTQRHLARTNKFVQQSYFIDYTWQSMLHGHTPVSITDITSPNTPSSIIHDYNSLISPLTKDELANIHIEETEDQHAKKQKLDIDAT